MDKLWSQTPAHWTVSGQCGPFTGEWRWDVLMNNHKHHASFKTVAEAQREAARMNYRHGSYSRPHLLGLDGIA